MYMYLVYPVHRYVEHRFLWNGYQMVSKKYNRNYKRLQFYILPFVNVSIFNLLNI